MGDPPGNEDASTAQEEGRLARIHAAHAQGYLDEAAMSAKAEETRKRLAALRQGAFGQKRFDAKRRILEKKATI